MDRRVPAIKRITTAETVANEIRKSITLERFHPGEWLKEKDLCEELNISRMPLREAFRILQSQNLVVYTPYMGVKVAEISLKEAGDFYDVRCELEVFSAGLAAENASDKQKNVLSELNAQMESMKENEFYEFREIDDQFHMAIANMSGNVAIGEVFEKLLDLTLIHRNASVQGKRTIQDACKEHSLIVSAILSNDVELARDYMRKHVISGKNGALATLCEQAVNDTKTL